MKLCVRVAWNALRGRPTIYGCTFDASKPGLAIHANTPAGLVVANNTIENVPDAGIYVGPPSLRSRLRSAVRAFFH